MQYRRLGTTDLEISRVGLGAWAMGGGGWRHGWGAQDEADSVAAIHAAIEAGINWIDTAPVYGLGRSEEVVGRALRGLPASKRPLVFTKCGLLFDRDLPDDGPHNVLAPESIRRELDDSLDRLGVDVVDLYQVHWPPNDGTPLEEYWGTLQDLKREGKVRAVGLSNHDLPLLEQAEAVGHVDSLQPPLSLIHRDVLSVVLPWCAEHATGVLAYSPLQSGLLTGAMTEERVATLPIDDWRASHPDFTGEGGARNLRLVQALDTIAREAAKPLSMLAISWVVAAPAVTGAIVGARSPRQLEEWIGAGDFDLDATQLEKIAVALQASGAGEGPYHPSTRTISSAAAGSYLF